MNVLQRNTKAELMKRGDFDRLHAAHLDVEIEPDGVAWIEVMDTECCFHPGAGWLIAANGAAEGKYYEDVGVLIRDAIAADLRYEQLSPEQRILVDVLRAHPSESP
jgi:hypothetical protein